MHLNIPEGQSGEWKVERFEIPQHSIEGIRCAMEGRPIMPGNYTRLMRGHSVIMSDTPAELDDLRYLFYAIQHTLAETVLINGLGLGVAVQKVLEFPSVKHIDVVEKSPDVIALVAPFLPHQKRFTIHHACAMEKQWPKGKRWDVVWHDIWDNIPNSDDLPVIAKLKRKYGRRCKWQKAWCEYYARR